MADAGPLIGLARARRLDLLGSLYQSVLVPPPAVATELRLETSRPGAGLLNEAVDDGWLRIVDVAPSEEIDKLATILDLGEAQAISLAESRNLRLLIDERRGRAIASHRGIVVVGTSAVLLAAKATGALDEVTPVLDELERQGYRLSKRLRARLVSLANES